MMACFMHFYKRINTYSLLFLLITCQSVLAGRSYLTVEHAALEPQGADYLLNARITADVDPVLSDAVTKGVPLSFLVTFELVEPRQYWFDHVVHTTQKRINLRYHALTKQYLIVSNNEQKAVETWREALQAITQIQGWSVVKVNMMQANKPYEASIEIELDKDQLPRAIQVDAIHSRDWTVASPVYEWPVRLKQ